MRDPAGQRSVRGRLTYRLRRPLGEPSPRGQCLLHGSCLTPMSYFSLNDRIDSAPVNIKATLKRALGCAGVTLQHTQRSLTYSEYCRSPGFPDALADLGRPAARPSPPAQRPFPSCPGQWRVDRALDNPASGLPGALDRRLKRRSSAGSAVNRALAGSAEARETTAASASAAPVARLSLTAPPESAWRPSSQRTSARLHPLAGLAGSTSRSEPAPRAAHSQRRTSPAVRTVAAHQTDRARSR